MLGPEKRRMEESVPRSLYKLSALQVGKLATKGRHGDGGGLYLAIGDGGRRRWVFVFRDRRTGKLREMGLGSSADVTLAKARVKAAKARAALADGNDPIAETKVQGSGVPTFGEFADEVVASLERGWRNEKHKAQWRMTLEEYCGTLRGLRVDRITTQDVLGVLQPIWQTKAETAGRIRGRIEKVLDAAKARGHRHGENPARWRGHLDHLLPARPKLQRGHHVAMPWDEVPAFVGKLRELDGVAARALEFTILTAARTGEVRGARWPEIDTTTRMWVVPARRMKAGREHRVPLTDRMLAILAEMEALKGTEDFVFPGQKRGRPLSDMSMEAVLRRLGAKPNTTHGFRSSFKDWANETTSFPNDLSEAALAHITGDKVERAYRRGDALERRRALMQAWCSFCEPGQASNVVLLRTPGQVED